MSRWSRARDLHNVMDTWLAPTIAIAIDQGLVEQWPFELTRSGRRFRSFDKLVELAGARVVHHAPVPGAPAEESSR